MFGGVSHDGQTALDGVVRALRDLQRGQCLGRHVSACGPSFKWPATLAQWRGPFSTRYFRRQGTWQSCRRSSGNGSATTAEFVGIRRSGTRRPGQSCRSSSALETHNKMGGQTCPTFEVHLILLMPARLCRGGGRTSPAWHYLRVGRARRLGSMRSIRSRDSNCDVIIFTPDSGSNGLIGLNVKLRCSCLESANRAYALLAATSVPSNESSTRILGFRLRGSIVSI